ncbi:MAG: hypothetical protein LIO94_08580 [Clostridiales bacterium]|nr:hypothetical protein [Clostridiales bacterium]
MPQDKQLSGHLKIHHFYGYNTICDNPGCYYFTVKAFSIARDSRRARVPKRLDIREPNRYEQVAIFQRKMSGLRIPVAMA